MNLLTKKNAPPLDSYVFQANKINVTSRVLTRFNHSHIMKNAPPPGGHVFQPKGIIFELVQDIIRMNPLTKFHEDQTINVASRVTIFERIQDISGTNLLSKFHEDRKINVVPRVLTRFQYSHIKKNAPPPGGHVFQPTGIIFKLFHEDQTINVASRVKNAPPLDSHVFQANVTIFKLIQDIIKTNLLTEFHEDLTINVAPRELTRQMLTAHDTQHTTD
ncbi:hypothetical protein DPMN_183628 [Dreissena polymorpha]|uniref:Uncharacterized protein n=1 Tax=Dreissena polymorpha TaxID=45954 RepID=A0A9D4DJB7_DREPO|nr:hypothetical protein DPMN_183628 [Dreissena polymorpha]